jgi:hypothetical protein
MLSPTCGTKQEVQLLQASREDANRDADEEQQQGLYQPATPVTLAPVHPVITHQHQQLSQAYAGQGPLSSK